MTRFGSGTNCQLPSEGYDDIKVTAVRVGDELYFYRSTPNGGNVQLTRLDCPEFPYT